MPDHEISRRSLILSAAAATSATAAMAQPNSTREYWLSVLTRIADPVLHALSQGKLKAVMPVEAPAGNERERREFTRLEAIGRLLCGISPWLELPGSGDRESALRTQYSELARRSIVQAVDPASADFLNFSHGSQPLVDAAFLALAILRAPVELWEKLDAASKSNLVKALRSTRIIRPGPSNWLLFSATIEAFFCRIGEPWDGMRVDYAVRQHNEWYKGDGAYGDGANFHFDYYNSFVIHPMLLQVVETTSKSPDPIFLERARRYAAIQERSIGPDGSFPPVGRSLAYRFGAFHLLADMALRRQLPEKVYAGTGARGLDGCDPPHD